MVSTIFNAPYREFGRTTIAGIFMFLVTISMVVGNYFLNQNYSVLIYIGMISVAAIFMFFVLGYYVEYSKNVLNGMYDLPEWHSFLKFWINGLKLMFAYLLYMVPALIFSLIAYFLMPAPGISTTSTLIFTGISVGYLILVFYMFPSILVTFSYNESFGEAFLIGAILRRAFTLRYLGRFILYFIYLIGLALICVAITALVAVIFNTFMTGSSLTAMLFVVGTILLSLARPIVDMTLFGMIAHMYEE